MEETCTCKTCKYFHQHYVKWKDGRYAKCDFGHCAYPRIKVRRRGTKACQHHKPIEQAQG